MFFELQIYGCGVGIESKPSQKCTAYQIDIEILNNNTFENEMINALFPKSFEDASVLCQHARSGKKGYKKWSLPAKIPIVKTVTVASLDRLDCLNT